MSTETDRLRRELEELRATDAPRISPYLEAFATIAEETEILRDALTRAQVNVEVPGQTEAIVALTDILSQLLTALQAKEMSVVVNVPKDSIQVDLIENEGKRQVRFQRDNAGRISSATVTTAAQ
jgi:hypothetical protein